MFKAPIYRGFELFVLFVLIPIVLVTDIVLEVKLALVALALVYLLLMSFFIEKNTFPQLSKLMWQRFLKRILVKFIIIAIVLSLFVHLSMPEKLFYVMLEKPKIWLLFVGIYIVFSVIPQELVYRTYFFSRYKILFKNDSLFILINAGLFALAHLFFANTLVILITFIGGLLFAYTYTKTKSTLFVMIEHALYGCWLYTVGMGTMLGFPT